MSLSSVFYVCLAVSLYPAICASRHQQELKEHFEHINKITEFYCDTPQPRLLTVEELLPHTEIQEKAFFPEVTVLHRCDRHCGSCDDATYTCGPTITTNITLIFKVTYLETMGIHDKGSWLMQYYNLDNHTQCGCFKVKKQDPFYPPDTSNQDSYGVSVNANPPIYTSPQPPMSSSDNVITSTSVRDEKSNQIFPTESVLEVTTPDETNPGPVNEESSQTYPENNGYGEDDSSTIPNSIWSNQSNDNKTWVDPTQWRSSLFASS